MFAVLSGLLRPVSGRVLLHGDDVTTASPQLRARRGLARTFQQPELFMGLTVREHVVLAHRVRYSRQRLWRDMIDPRSLRPDTRYHLTRQEFGIPCPGRIAFQPARNLGYLPVR